MCCEGFLQCKRKKLQKSNRMYCELRNNELFVFEAEPGVAYSSPLLTTDSVSKNRKSLNVDGAV